jgi:carnitine O-palmitoyltransferase 1
MMETSSTAATTLERVESAIFHVCLSSAAPETEEELMNLGCTGHGSDVWMDKSFTMLVTSNGKMVFNMEHSHADAPMHSRMIE